MVGGDYSSPGLVLRCPKYPSLKNGTEKTMRLAKLNRNIPFATNKNHLPPFRPFLIPLTLSRHLLTQSPILNSKPKTQSHSLVLLSLYSLLFLCRFVVSLFSFFFHVSYTLLLLLLLVFSTLLLLLPSTVDNSFQFDATRDLLRELDVNDIVWIGLMRPQNSDRFMWS